MKNTRTAVSGQSQGTGIYNLQNPSTTIRDFEVAAPTFKKLYGGLKGLPKTVFLNAICNYGAHLGAQQVLSWAEGIKGSVSAPAGA